MSQSPRDGWLTSTDQGLMRHTILGAGGVGGLVGACLARAGEQVSFIVRRERLNEYPKQLQLESPFGNIAADVRWCASLPSDTDNLWITVKATQLEAALASVPDAGGTKGIVPLLNGIDHLALLKARYGAGRVIPATIAVESERVAPGLVIHRSPFARLNLLSQGRALLGTTVTKLQGIGFACNFIDDEPTLMWSKLVFLAPLALATTASGKTTSDIHDDPGMWHELQACVREACAVAAAEGAKVKAEAVISTIAGLPAGMRSSMQKDVERGLLPELDAIGGPIIKGARRHGVNVPATEALIAKVESRMRASA
jgi:2-dehydropantoate 2-reductase